MQKAIRCSLFALSVTVFISIIQPQASGNKGLAQWEDPFPRISVTLSDLPDTLTLQDALSLVALANPLLKAGPLLVRAAESDIRQAGAMSNPEFEIEAEDAGGDLAGLGESEITVLLSQEIEIWGQRGAHRDLAAPKSSSTSSK
jgi:outer membrane protein TolC